MATMLESTATADGARIQRAGLRIVLTNFRSPWALGAGGGQMATHDLAVALAARGHDVRAIYPGAAAAAPYPVSWVPASDRPLVTAFRVARTAKSLLSTFDADVVHSSGYEGAWLPPARRRFATSNHPDLPVWQPPGWARPWAHLPYMRRQQQAWLERRALARADGAIFVSAFARDQAQERGYPTRTCRVIPNGVDPALFSPLAEEPPLPPVYFFAGRLEQQKGVDVLLEAFRKLPRGPRLRIAGTGPQEEEYRQLASSLGLDGAVRFLGAVPRPKLPALMCEAHVFVLPSRYENLPLSILEAMACARPVVAARVGGVAEMIDDGVEGILVPPDDAHVLALALRRLLEAAPLRKRMGEAGRARVLGRFTWDAVAAQTEAFYGELLHR
jgi:glycosyltransferase involved in cell wall biosynthesis